MLHQLRQQQEPNSVDPPTSPTPYAHYYEPHVGRHSVLPSARQPYVGGSTNRPYQHTRARSAGNLGLVVRNADEHLVKVVCPDCERDTFSNIQGFLNHCRMAHGREHLTRDEAVQKYGVPLSPTELGVSNPPPQPRLLSDQYQQSQPQPNLLPPNNLTKGSKMGSGLAYMNGTSVSGLAVPGTTKSSSVIDVPSQPVFAAEPVVSVNASKPQLSNLVRKSQLNGVELDIPAFVDELYSQRDQQPLGLGEDESAEEDEDEVEGRPLSGRTPQVDQGSKRKENPRDAKGSSIKKKKGPGRGLSSVSHSVRWPDSDEDIAVAVENAEKEEAEEEDEEEEEEETKQVKEASPVAHRLRRKVCDVSIFNWETNAL